MFRFQPAEQLAHRQRRLLAALAHVHVRVGAISDEEIDALHHALGDVAVQVEGGGDGDIRSHRLAHHGEEGAVGIVILGGEAGAVGADVDAVQGLRRLQSRAPFPHQALEECVHHGAVRLRLGEADWHRRPGTAAIHGGDKARQLRREARRGGARLRQQLGPRGIGARGEIRLDGRRRELVALDGEAEEGDARRGSCGHGRS